MKEEISKKIKKMLIILDIIFIVFIAFTFLFKSKITNILYPLCVSFFMLITFYSIIFLGYRKNKRNKYKDKMNNKFILFSIIYLVIIYIMGNATSYVNNTNIINGIYIILLMLLMEITRYIVLSKCTLKSNQQYIFTFILILFDIFILSNIYLNSMNNITELFAIIVIAIIKNIILSYTTTKYGFYPCFTYCFVSTVMPLSAPIYPNLGSYLNLVFFIMYSALLAYNITQPIHKNEEDKNEKYNKGFCYYAERLLLIFVIFIIFLVSGNFKYSLSAVASDSMYPELKRGDAIILEKTDKSNIDKLEKGMIVAFYQDEQIITHRILSIDEEDGIECITTKGDNNTTKDVTKKKKDDIIGIVKFKIPYLGYPSVEISDIKNK